MKASYALAVGRRLLLPLLPLALAGCASSAQFWPSENASLRHAPKEAWQILVVPKGAPSRPYKIVGSMDVSLNEQWTGSYATNLAWFTDRFREKAAEVGADGIMNLKIVRSGTSTLGTTFGSTTRGGTSTETVTGTTATEIYEMTADAFVLVRP